MYFTLTREVWSVFVLSSAQTAQVGVCRGGRHYSTQSDMLSTEGQCPPHPLSTGSTNSHNQTTLLTPI